MRGLPLDDGVAGTQSEGMAGTAGTGTGGAGGGGMLPNKLTQCTADLKRVLDMGGVVLQECGVDQGCFEGECIEACEAAAKSKGNVGCEFYAPDPPFAGQGWVGADVLSMSLKGPCYAAFVANAWDGPVKISVERNGVPFDAAQIARIPRGNVPNVTYDPLPPEGLPPDEVAILFLSHQPGVMNGGSSLECPIPPAEIVDAAVTGSARGAAYSITTDRPVSAYAILPYGGALSFLPSATLLMPRTAWGSNYVAVSPHELVDPMNPMQPGILWSMLVGTVDGTTVEVAPRVTLPGGAGVDEATAGSTTTHMINAGEILQWLGGDPTGMIVEADNPVGLFTGNTYLHITSATSTGGGHDSAHQQIPHVTAQGSEYVAPGMVTRLSTGEPESIPYRVMGVVDGTMFSYDPAPPAGAPTALNIGDVAQFEANAPFTIRSQDDDHPFIITQYMTGTLFPASAREDCSPVMPTAAPPPIPFPFPIDLPDTNYCGDEEWVNVLPPEQFLKRYVFFTDPTYSTTTLVFTRVKGPEGFKPVTVDCIGEIGFWEPVGSDGKFEVAYADLMRAGEPIGTCNKSQHVAESDAQFGVTVWGYDHFASYAYPAGGNVGSINEVVVPTPD